MQLQERLGGLWFASRTARGGESPAGQRLQSCSRQGSIPLAHPEPLPGTLCQGRLPLCSSSVEWFPPFAFYSCWLRRSKTVTRDGHMRLMNTNPAVSACALGAPDGTPSFPWVPCPPPCSLPIWYPPSLSFPVSTTQLHCQKGFAKGGGNNEERPRKASLGTSDLGRYPALLACCCCGRQGPSVLSVVQMVRRPT